ncbi:MAG: DUF3138 family protein [Microbacteriaceae bacterium]|nr:DUF3138 family protein [Burkholderiaceae bacterium]
MKRALNNMDTSKRQPGETAPAIAYRVDYAKGEFNGVGFAGVHGKAANFRAAGVNPVTSAAYNPADTPVDLFEVDGHFIRGDWTLQGQLSYGQQKVAAITAEPVSGDLRDARWYGASALAADKFMPRWEAIGRVDHLNNRKNGGGLLGYTVADSRNGIGPAYGGDTSIDPNLDPNKGSNRTALSMGLSWLYNVNTTFKAEARHDSANLPVFFDIKTGQYRKSNTVFGSSMLVSF